MKFKALKTKYLDKEKFSSVKLDELWTKLVNFVKSVPIKYSNIEIKPKEQQIKLVINNPENVKLITEPIEQSNVVADKDIVKTMKLNVKFSPAGKCLIIADNNQNIEELSTVTYSAKLTEDKINPDSLFFCADALVNYVKDEEEELTNDVIALVTFKEELSGRTTNKMMYVAFDTVSNLIDYDKWFDSLNNGIPSALLENLSGAIDGIVRINIENEEINYSDFKIGKSMFKINDENDFIAFKSFVPTLVFNDFIDNTLKESENLFN